MMELVGREGNAVRFRLAGTVTDDDYEQVLIPTISAILDWHERVNCVMEFSDEYEGYELGALWEDAKFGLKHKNDFERVGVVGASRWMDWGVRIGDRLMDGELRTFPSEQADAAWTWVKDEQASAQTP